MFSRRLLRIKVLQILYAYHKVNGKTYSSTEKELLHSLKKSYDLYYLLMLLITDVADYAESRIMQAREKRIPTEEDLNPNTRFIDNRVIAQLREHPALKTYLNNNSLSWVQYPEIIRNLYSYIIEYDEYKKYMEIPSSSYREDKRIITLIYADIVMNYEDLYLNLEEQSIYWTDDVDFVLKMIVKTVNRFSPDLPAGGSLMPMFKEMDDQEYLK